MLGRVTLGKFGRASQKEDGDWWFPDSTPTVDTLDEGDVVGFCYTVEGSGEAVTVELSVVFHEEGEPVPAPDYLAVEVQPRTHAVGEAARRAPR